MKDAVDAQGQAATSHLSAGNGGPAVACVLVVDDRAADRELLATMLRFAGYAVVEASSGKAALASARAKRPDLITADILMPEMSGYEFVRQVREDPAISDIPVIFCASSYDEEESRRLSEAFGVTQILIKPCVPGEVVRVVKTALGSGDELAAEQFDGQQLSVLNEKLVQKAIELEVANREQAELQQHLREAERQAAESLTLLETLQATAPVGFGFVDLDFRFIRMNETLAAFNGLPLQEQLGRTVGEVVPDLWPELQPMYRYVLDSGEAVINHEIESQSSESMGHGRFWLASCYPVRIESEVIGIGLVVVDITELKHAEDFRSVVMDNMAEGLYAVDHEGLMTFMNSAASKMLGWREDELHGKPVHETIHFQRADGSPSSTEDGELIQARVRGKTIRINEGAYTRKDGTIFPVAYSAAPLLRGTSISGAVVVFRDTTEETEERLRRQRELDALTWVGAVRDALDEDRLVLHSQPIIPLAGGEASEELLLRMVGRNGEIIPPGSFLPIAERYGQIGEIDRWVIGEAIRLAAGGRQIQANLSAKSISDLDLLSRIENQLRDTQADPGKVVFELTETALMENLEAGETFARGLEKIGCRLALDDFGTGFGSFTYLKTIPISYLKIDIDFVRDLASNHANQHLVKATVGLARDFGYETIAEGVEDAETLALLNEYGVDFGQGFYLGLPGPLENT